MRAIAYICAFALLCLGCAIALAVEPQPRQPAEMVREGRLLLERGTPSEALKAFTAVLKADPALIDAHRGYQDAMLALDRKEAVCREYRKKVETEGESAAACYLYSRLLDDAEEERRWLEKALEKEEGFAWAHYGIARLLLNKGDKNGAESHLRRAIESQPDMADAYRALGLLHIGRTRVEQAKEVYLEALKALPLETFPHEALAEIYLNEEKPTEALELITAAVELRADVPAYHTLQAEILHRMGRREEALKALRAVLDLDPTPDDSIYAFEVSEKISTPGLDLNAVDKELYKMAVAKLNEGNADEALKRLSSLVKRKSGVAMLHYQIGRAYEHKDETQKAAASLQKAIELEPCYAEPYYMMARIHYNLALAQRDDETARKQRRLSEDLANLATELHPFYPFPYRLLGRIYHDRGGYEAAVKFATYYYRIRHDYGEIGFLMLDELRIVDEKEKPIKEFQTGSFNVKVYPPRQPTGHPHDIILRFLVYKDGKIYKHFFAEVQTPEDEETGEPASRYYLCEIMDEENNTHRGFLSEEDPPSMANYELVIGEVLAQEASGD